MVLMKASWSNNNCQVGTFSYEPWCKTKKFTLMAHNWEFFFYSDQLMTSTVYPSPACERELGESFITVLLTAQVLENKVQLD